MCILYMQCSITSINPKILLMDHTKNSARIEDLRIVNENSEKIVISRLA
jgi:hypothetical protein